MSDRLDEILLEFADENENNMYREEFKKSREKAKQAITTHLKEIVEKMPKQLIHAYVDDDEMTELAYSKLTVSQRDLVNKMYAKRLADLAKALEKRGE